MPNPIVRLTHLLDSMRDESGRILIKGFYDEVKPPGQTEPAALAKIPDVEGDLRREFQIGATEGEKKNLNELLLQPALNVRGIEAGHVGENASNTIQPEARASIDFRLVPNESLIRSSHWLSDILRSRAIIWSARRQRQRSG